MKIKTSELTGAALDWAVALAEDVNYSHPDVGPAKPSYSTDWSLGGPIIEREVIALIHPKWDCWTAQARDGTDLDVPLYTEDGPTPLIAAMRCFCASRLGEEVEIPDELLEN